MRRNLGWAVGYRSLPQPSPPACFEPLGFVLRPDVGAISMSGSSVIVALNAVSLKRLSSLAAATTFVAHHGVAGNATQRRVGSVHSRLIRSSSTAARLASLVVALSSAIRAIIRSSAM